MRRAGAAPCSWRVGPHFPHYASSVVCPTTQWLALAGVATLVAAAAAGGDGRALAGAAREREGGDRVRAQAHPDPGLEDGQGARGRLGLGRVPLAGTTLRRVANYVYPFTRVAWSADGRRLAYAAWRPSRLSRPRLNIVVVSADGGGRRWLTSDDGHDYQPAFSPDGKRIAFTSDRSDADGDLWVMNADGSGQLVAAGKYGAAGAGGVGAGRAPHRVHAHARHRTPLDRRRARGGRRRQADHMGRARQLRARVVARRQADRLHHELPRRPAHLGRRRGRRHAARADGPRLRSAGVVAGRQAAPRSSATRARAPSIWLMRSAGGGLRRVTNGTSDRAPAWRP